jgi:hypothetical protein
MSLTVQQSSKASLFVHKLLGAQMKTAPTKSIFAEICSALLLPLSCREEKLTEYQGHQDKSDELLERRQQLEEANLQVTGAGLIHVPDLLLPLQSTDSVQQTNLVFCLFALLSSFQELLHPLPQFSMCGPGRHAGSRAQANFGYANNAVRASAAATGRFSIEGQIEMIGVSNRVAT